MGLGRDFRLPRDVRPLRYALQFDLDLERWRFAGSERIRLTFDRPRRELYLHAVDLEIATATAHAAERAIALTVSPEREAEAIELRADSDLGPGEVDLDLAFTGPIRDDLKAIYRSTIGEQRIAATQLAPADARRAFPCFDEPEFKARFALELVGPAEADAVANTPIESMESLANGRRRWRFAATP
ncbi:MAG TPA: M1 family peptidase, partial [Candidatus Dormibacteraeota bacterium]|nr:M1 family peptidase [Candidatus Dormibacteraeota bacterium]